MKRDAPPPSADRAPRSTKPEAARFSEGAEQGLSAIQFRRSVARLPVEEQVRALRPSRPLQFSGVGPGGADIHSTAASGLGGVSGPLPHLDAVQASFGSHDVSNVKAHTGETARAASRELGARGYASGDHAAFASASPDLHTVAHEAAHVVQQRAGVSLKGGVGQAGDRYEQHADAVADAVVQGHSAESLLSRAPGAENAAGAPEVPSSGGAVQRQATPPDPDAAKVLALLFLGSKLPIELPPITGGDAEVPINREVVRGLTFESAALTLSPGYQEITAGKVRVKASNLGPVLGGDFELRVKKGGEVEAEAKGAILQVGSITATLDLLITKDAISGNGDIDFAADLPLAGKFLAIPSGTKVSTVFKEPLDADPGNGHYLFQNAALRASFKHGSRKSLISGELLGEFAQLVWDGQDVHAFGRVSVTEPLTLGAKKKGLKLTITEDAAADVTIVKSELLMLVGTIAATLEEGKRPLVTGEFKGVAIFPNQGAEGVLITGYGQGEVYYGLTRDLVLIEVTIGSKTPSPGGKKKKASKPIRGGIWLVESEVEAVEAEVPFSISSIPLIPGFGEKEKLISGSAYGKVSGLRADQPMLENLVGTVTWHPETYLYGSADSLFNIGIGAKKPKHQGTAPKKKKKATGGTSIVTTITNNELSSISFQNLWMEYKRVFGGGEGGGTARTLHLLGTIGEVTYHHPQGLDLSFLADCSLKSPFPIVGQASARGDQGNSGQAGGGGPPAKKIIIRRGSGVSAQWLSGEFAWAGLDLGVDVVWPLGGQTLAARGKLAGMLGANGSVSGSASLKLTTPLTIGTAPTGAGGQAGGTYLSIKKGATLDASFANNGLVSLMLSGLDFTGRLLGHPIEGQVKEAGFDENGVQLTAKGELTKGITIPSSAGGTQSGGTLPLAKTSPFPAELTIKDGTVKKAGVEDVNFQVGKKGAGKRSKNPFFPVSGRIKKGYWKESGWTFKGDVKLGKSGKFGKPQDMVNSPVLRVTDGTIGLAVEDDEPTEVGGSLSADVLDAQQRPLLTAQVLGKVEFLEHAWPITGIAMVETVEPISLLDGKVVLHPGAEGAVVINRNRLDEISVNDVEVTVNALQKGGIKGRIDSLKVVNGDDGITATLEGGEIGPVKLADGKVELWARQIDYADGVFDACIYADFDLQHVLKGATGNAWIAGYVSSANDWIPEAYVGAEISAKLVEARNWFKMPKQGDLKNLVDIDVKFTLPYAIPAEFGIDVGTSLSIGNTELWLDAELASEPSGLDLDDLTLPDMSGSIALRGGIIADAKLAVSLFLGVGESNSAAAGISATLIGQAFLAAGAEAGGTFETRDGEYGGSIDFGLDFKPSLVLTFIPALTLKVLGEDAGSILLGTESYTFTDLFEAQSKQWSFLFGPLHGDQPSGEAMSSKAEPDVASEFAESAGKTEEVESTSSFDPEMPGTEQGGGMMEKLKHIKNAVDVAANFMSVINWIDKLIPKGKIDKIKKFPDDPDLDDIADLLALKVDPNEILEVFTKFNEACQRAEDEGTLDWLADALPEGLKFIPDLVRLYLAGVEATYKGIESTMSWLGYETPSDVRERVRKEIALLNQTGPITCKYVAAGLNTKQAKTLAEFWVEVRKSGLNPDRFDWLEDKSFGELHEAAEKAKPVYDRLVGAGVDEKIAALIALYRQREYLTGQFPENQFKYYQSTDHDATWYAAKADELEKLFPS